MPPKTIAAKTPTPERRRSCLPSCFLRPRASEFVETTDSRLRPARQPSCFWWSSARSRRRKMTSTHDSSTKVVPVTTLGGGDVNPASKTLAAESSDKKGHSGEPREGASSRRHSQPRPPEVNVLPRISSKYASRTQPVASPSSPMTDPNQNKRNTTGPGSPETGQAVGLSIMAATLVVMVLFGRISAVVCLAATLYLLPRILRVATTKDRDANKAGKSSIEVDLDSEEYKKRVVLEGLLERKGRRSPDSLAANFPTTTR